MGPQSLTLPGAGHAYWSRLPRAGDVSRALGVLGTLAAHIATVLDVPAPTRPRPRADPAELGEALDVLERVHCTPELLGATWEHMMSPSERRSRGAHFTPVRVAATVTGLVMEQARSTGAIGGSETAAPPTIWDPTAGGGVFLLAAARWLETRSPWGRAEIVSSLYATDVDPVAIDVCVAALEIWCGGKATPHVGCLDSLLEHPPGWPETFTAVVGNPPFLGQLSRDTVRDPRRRTALEQRFPDVAGGYVDDAAVFLHLALDKTAPGGATGLVLPESLLGARDTHDIRAAADRRAALTTLWVDTDSSFDASVDVVAPIFAVPRPAFESSAAEEAATTVHMGGDTTGRQAPRPNGGQWAGLLAAARGVPMVRIGSAHGTIGDRASVTAGFRQHFYGIADVVEEEAAASRDHEAPRLVTSGAIDPLHVRWGSRPVRFAGTKWHKPVVALNAIADDRVRSWFRDRCRPKLLLATQTRVIEVIVDADAQMVPSVPVLSVEPKDEEDLWRLAAVLTSPVASAWIAQRATGTGLSPAALRVRAADVAELPLPTVQSEWERGADAAQRAQTASHEGSMQEYARALAELAASMGSAYGIDHDVSTWWWERLRLPEGVETEAY